MNLWLFGIILFLAGYGAQRLVSKAYQAARRRIVRWLMDRHEKKCTVYGEKWNSRIVRNAISGEVGYCIQVCVKEQGLRDLVFPRWVAHVTTEAAMAGYLTKPPESVFSAIFRSFTKPSLIGSPGTIKIPLKVLTLAGSEDTQRFTTEMKGATEHE